MVITDLTNTTWYVPSGATINAGVGKFSVDCSVDAFNGATWTNFDIGYNWDSNDGGDSFYQVASSGVISVGTLATVDTPFTVTFLGGADATNTSLISFLTTYGIQLKVTDLTDTTWTVKAGWEAEAGYGTFSVNGTYDGAKLIGIGIGHDGEEAQEPASNVINCNAINYYPDEELVLTFTGGTDTTNPALIAWLSKWGELQVEEEGEAPPDDLTGYTVSVPAGWTATAGYGSYALEGTFYSTEYDATDSFGLMFIGYYDDFGDRIPSANSVQLSGYVLMDTSKGFTLNLTGGDTSSSSLIQWLVDNNATFTKTGGEEEPEEPENPEEESAPHAVEVYYKGNNIAFLDAGETIAIHMKDKSSPFKLTEDLIIKANVLENSSGGGASFGNGYTVTFMSQGAAWAVSGITPGQAVQRPTSPTKDGAYFNGWYTGENGTGDKIGFPYTPSADVTFYAKFSEATIVGVTGLMNEDGSLTLTDDVAGMEGYEETQNGDYVTVTSNLGEAFPFNEIEELTDDSGNVFVKFPKLWMKWEVDDSDRITGYKFANYQADDDFFVPDAFLDPNYVTTDTYLDYFALGKYEMSGSTSKGYSKSGATCLTSITRANARAAARAYGSSSNLYNGYQQLDFAQLTLYNLMCMMFYQTSNIQKVYGGRTGSGTVTSWGAASVTGTTDGVDGLNGWNVSTDCVKMLGVENPYGNINKWVDGVYFSSATIYAHRFPQQYADSTSNGTALGFSRPTSSAYIKSLKKGTASKTRSYVYCAETGGGASQYCGDYCYYNSSGVVLCAGGGWSNGGLAGLWYLNGYYDASNAYANLGARLSFRPL